MTERRDFESLLKQAMGLDAVSIGKTRIERSVKLRMENLRLESEEEYWRHLQGSTAELQELIETVVVPETWFLRDEQAFATLARLAIDGWGPPPLKTAIRLLSIPCSTGEEPYSMLMTLLDAGFGLDDVQIDAVDISERALARARMAVYSGNSFRVKNLAFRERYFHPVRDGYALAPRFSEKVSFRQANLLSDDFRLNGGPYDIIFCRNLLIYFDNLTQAQVLKTLSGCLSPTGYLFVGPAEAFLTSRNGFASVNHAMSFAFRKACLTGRSAPAATLPLKVKPVRNPPAQRRASMAKRDLPCVPVAPSFPCIADAQCLADTGRLTEAAISCEELLRRAGPSADAYYLLGLVRSALGDQRGAGESYRKALYLEPDHGEALSHLAVLTEAEGDMVGAKRLRERFRRAEERAGSQKS